MKPGIHPRYAPVVINCVGCGTKIETRSAKGKNFSIDVCSHCHPFYTGRQKFVDSAGRVERFQKKWAAMEKKAPKGAAKAEEAAAAPEAVAAEKK
jgi:large subunit ribosomal protein L31